MTAPVALVRLPPGAPSGASEHAHGDGDHASRHVVRQLRRLERDLHDGVQQRLVVLAMLVGQVERALEAGCTAGARAAIASLGEQLDLAVDELHAFTRGEHPPLLTEAGLGAAIVSLARTAPVPAVLRVDLERRPPPEVEAAGYYVVAETLSNVAKHAHADAVRLDVGVRTGSLVVEVVDDGIGGADPSRGSGLLGLADRVGALGGQLTVDSRPGGGTRVRAEIPLASRPDHEEVGPGAARCACR